SQCCAMAAGSSEKTVTACMSPCLRRTQCPSLMSIAGMISMAAGSWKGGGAENARIAASGARVPGDEVGEQLEAGAVALLGVELGREDISPRHRASKRRGVVGGRRHDAA